MLLAIADATDTAVSSPKALDARQICLPIRLIELVRGRCDPETDRCDLLTVWPLVGRRPVFDGYPLIASQETGKTSVDIAATKHCLRRYHRWFFMASTEFSTSRRFGPNACFSMLLVISCRMRFQLIDIHPRRLQLIAKAMTLPPVLRDGKLRQMLCNTDQRPKLRIAHRRSTWRQAAAAEMAGARPR